MSFPFDDKTYPSREPRAIFYKCRVVVPPWTLRTKISLEKKHPWLMPVPSSAAKGMKYCS
jgi:hypothetical protein